MDEFGGRSWGCASGRRLIKLGIGSVMPFGEHSGCDTGRTRNAGDLPILRSGALRTNAGWAGNPFWRRTWRAPKPAMAAHPVVLCLQDTTELDFNGQDIDGFGTACPMKHSAACMCIQLMR